MTTDDLRARLAAADAAAALPALDPAERAALLEHAADAPARPPHRPRRALVLGGALLAAAAVATAVVPPTTSGGGTTVRLALPDGSMLSCAPLSAFAAEALATSTLALAGRVESVEGRTVVIRPERTYRGERTDRVELLQPATAAEDGTTIDAGQEVLLAADGTGVRGCGLTGVASPDLQRYYDAAFG